MQQSRHTKGVVMPRKIASKWLVSVLCMYLFGCAAAPGPTYSSLRSQIPAVGPGQGRLFFYRESADALGFKPVSLDILVDNQKVKSEDVGVFFVDVPPGAHAVSCAGCVTPENVPPVRGVIGLLLLAKNAGQRIEFNIGAGESRYIRIEPGAALYRMLLVDPEQGNKDVLDLPYITR